MDKESSKKTIVREAAVVVAFLVFIVANAMISSALLSKFSKGTWQRDGFDGLIGVLVLFSYPSFLIIRFFLWTLGTLDEKRKVKYTDTELLFFLFKLLTAVTAVILVASFIVALAQPKPADQFFN